MGAFGRDTSNKRTRIWTRGSATVVAFVHAARKRRRTLVIGGVIAAVAAVVVAFGVTRYLQAEAAKRVVNSYGSLSTCLLGAPLAEGEAPSRRVRAIQLDAVTKADITRTVKDGAPWPDRCAAEAHKLAEGVGASALADEPEGEKLLVAAKDLAAALEQKDAYFTDLSTPVDGLFGAANAANIALGDAGSVPPAPAAHPAPGLDGLGKPVVGGSLDLDAISMSPAAPAIHFLVDDVDVPESPFICRVTVEQLACHRIAQPAAAAKGLRLLGGATGEAEPLVFAKSGVFRAATGRALDEEAVGVAGHHLAGEAAVAVTDDDGRLVLIEADGDDVSKGSLFISGDVLAPKRDVLLLGEHLFILTLNGDEMTLQTARRGDRGMSRLEKVGVLEGAAPDGEAVFPRLEGCTSSRSLAVRVRVGERSYVSMWDGKVWTAPVSVDVGPAMFACEAKGASFTRTRPSRDDSRLGAKLIHHACGEKSCTPASTDFGSLLVGEPGLAPQGLVEATGLGDQVMLLWRAGQRGGLRLRLAPMAKLSETDDRVLLDDLRDGTRLMPQSGISDLRVVPGDRFAALFISTDRGLSVATVDAEGELRPLAAKWP